MLPFDRKPWAKHLALAVVILSFAGAIWLAFYFYSNDALHISEVVGIVLLLLTIVPPNLAIMNRRDDVSDPLTEHRTFGHTPPAAR